MVDFLELSFSTPKGVQIATVFKDLDGNVVSEHGLENLLDELKRRKKAKNPPTMDPEVIAQFFDFNSKTSKKMEELRKKYLIEKADSEASGCSKCDRAAIYRKYAAAANKIHG